MLEYLKKLIRRREKPPSPLRADLKARFKLKYAHSKELIASNDEILVLITDLQEKLTGNYVFGMAYIRSTATRAAFHAFRMVKNLNLISGDKYPGLYDSLEKINLRGPQSVEQISEEIQGLIITAPVPAKLEEAILNAYQELADRLGREPRVSLRSSAIGEDSELSYAGQYLSALNVPREKIIQTYEALAKVPILSFPQRF
ncbi:MAG: hypothetical protein D4R73_02280 [Deltaproteobacteria bacterium]|nr:MAG: hypothetical protein D4R73_02280 [Deltaproteobacteria bacterium]